ncbi:hypothetical protein BSKO_03857 [Bryopsis sp. KO-2023]|nr:hypothetical protein BSKO_03857 [Bryopsis sp. KO-2023]
MGKNMDSQVTDKGGGGGNSPSGSEELPSNGRVRAKNLDPLVIASSCLYFVIGASILGLLFYVFTSATYWGRRELWEKVYEDMTVRSREVKMPGFDKGVPILRIELLYTVTTFWWWCSPLAAVLASILVLCIPQRRFVTEKFASVKKLLCTEIPVKFLEKHCDGMSVGELMMILIWLGINATYFQYILRVKISYFDDIHKGTREPFWALRMDAVAFSLGVCAFTNFAWVVFPVARHSPIFDALGLSFEKRIRYHRWLSIFALSMITVHGFLYWLMWALRGQWLEKAWEWEGPLASSLAGAIALGCGLCMWATAISFFRRKYFEIFYRTHVIGFVGFVIFANIHVPFYVYWSAGLLMYVVDVGLRMAQLSVPVSIDSSETNSDGTITTVRMKAPKGLSTNSVPTIWVSCPNLSICQWHPVTPTISTDGHLQFSFKSFGKWTKALATMSKNGQLTSLKVEGPHDICTEGFYKELMQQESWVFCAGGIAITPILSMLRVLEDGFEREASKDNETLRRRSTGGLPSIKLIWVVRNAAELEVGSADLLRLERKYPEKVSIEAYITGSKDKKIVDEPSIQPLTTARRILKEMVGRNPSPAVLPAHAGPLHLAFLYIVSYCAGFAGLLLGNAWRMELVRSKGPPLAMWKSSIVMFLCVMLMSIGWVTLMILPFQFVMLFKARKENQPANTPSKQKNPDSATTKKFDDGHQQAYTTELLDRSHPGRPDFKSLLGEVKHRSAVAVLASGPDPLIASVKKACDSLGIDSFSKAAFTL